MEEQEYKIINEDQLSREQKSESWDLAIGLQEVDNLKVSKYLVNLSRDNIKGKISSYDVYENINNYYKKENISQTGESTKEADLVSSKINILINSSGFTFAPVTLQNIHKFLFEDVYDHAGQIRKQNFRKDEDILNGESVVYENYFNIEKTLDYDFEQFQKQTITKLNIIKKIAKFTSDIWQVHPFSEGNTRTTAVFIIKYLKSLNIEITNDIFKNNSLYFRNTLVRANYADFKNDIIPDSSYLEEFFDCAINNVKRMFNNENLFLDKAPNHNFGHGRERVEHEVENNVSEEQKEIVNDKLRDKKV